MYIDKDQRCLGEDVKSINLNSNTTRIIIERDNCANAFFNILDLPNLGIDDLNILLERKVFNLSKSDDDIRGIIKNVDYYGMLIDLKDKEGNKIQDLCFCAPNKAQRGDDLLYFIACGEKIPVPKNSIIASQVSEIFPTIYLEDNLDIEDNTIVHSSFRNSVK